MKKLNKKLSVIIILLLFMSISCGGGNGGDSDDPTGPTPEEALEIIRDCAENGNCDDITIELLATAGVVRLIEENLEDYKTAIASAGSIADLAELQAIIDAVNASKSAARWGSARWGESNWNP